MCAHFSHLSLRPFDSESGFSRTLLAPKVLGKVTVTRGAPRTEGPICRGLSAHLSIQEFEIKSRKMSSPDTPGARKSTIDYETVRFGFPIDDGALFACRKVSAVL